jgi:hypothetical protein
MIRRQKRRKIRRNIRNRIVRKKKTQRPLYASVDWEKAKQIFQTAPETSLNSTLTESLKRIPVKDILRVVAAVGIIGIIFTCPPAGAALGTLFLDGKPYRRWKVRSTLDQLVRQKYVSVKNHEDGSITVTITKQGMTRALTYQLNTMRLTVPKKWDKKWRVVMFDVPNRYGRTRDVFRKRLEQLGLRMVQKSVFISPYPCFKEVEFLRELYGIAITVQYLLVEKIEGDAQLKHQFNL